MSKDLTTLANVFGTSRENIASMLDKSVAIRGLKFEELLKLRGQLAIGSKAERKVKKQMLRKAVTFDELVTVRNTCSCSISIRAKATRRVVQQINTLPELERLYSNVLNSYEDQEAIKQRMLQVITTPSEARNLLVIFGGASIDIRLIRRWNELSLKELKKLKSIDQMIDLRFDSYGGGLGRQGKATSKIDVAILKAVHDFKDAKRACHVLRCSTHRRQAIKKICKLATFDQLKQLVSDDSDEELQLSAWERMLDLASNFEQAKEAFACIPMLPNRMERYLQQEALIRLMKLAPDNATQREVFSMASRICMDLTYELWLKKKLLRIARSRLS